MFVNVRFFEPNNGTSVSIKEQTKENWKMYSSSIRPPSSARRGAPRRPPTSMWYHELENPECAFVLPFFRYVAQLNRRNIHNPSPAPTSSPAASATGTAASSAGGAADDDGEWFPVNGLGGGSGISARSVKSMDAKMNAPHYVLAAAHKRSGTAQQPATRKLAGSAAVMANSILVRPVPVRIPDTVVFMRRMPRAWYTYDEDARNVLRLPPLSLDTVRIFDHFSAVLPNSDGICALFFSTDPADETSSLVVQPLRPEELAAFLGGRPSILDRCPDGALQKYVPVSARSNGVTEVVWSPSACGVYPAQIQTFKEIAPSAIRSSDESTGLTVAALHDQCFGMIGYFLPDLLRSERRKIIRFSALFRVDTESKVWLLGATCVRCAPAHEPFNNAIPRMPMGLLRPAPFKAPRLDLVTPTLTVGKPPPQRPANTPRTAASDTNPFFFTPLHLSKPFGAGASAIDVASRALPCDLLFSALEREIDLIHFARETNAFLGSEVSPPKPASHRDGGSPEAASSCGDGDTLRSYHRNASMRFSRRGFGAGLGSTGHGGRGRGAGAAGGAGGGGLGGDGCNDGETETQRQRRVFHAELKRRTVAVAAFSRKTAELVTETLLDALSGGLSLTMHASEWKVFVGNIIMYLDSAAWETALQSDKERAAVVRILESAVGAKAEMLPDLGAKKQLTAQKEAQLQSLHRSHLIRNQPHYGEDEEVDDEDYGDASMDGNQQHRQHQHQKQHTARQLTARELTSFDDVGPPTFSFQHLAQPDMASLHSSTSAVASTALKTHSGVMGRYGRRTITAEATEWLWVLQRGFEERSKQVLAELEESEKSTFELSLSAVAAAEQKHKLDAAATTSDALNAMMHHACGTDDDDADADADADASPPLPAVNDDDNDQDDEYEDDFEDSHGAASTATATPSPKKNSEAAAAAPPTPAAVPPSPIPQPPSPRLPRPPVAVAATVGKKGKKK